MHLYKFFHPHHNPSLYKVPIRMQELTELRQAAVEMQNAIKRAQLRTQKAPIGPIRENHFDEILQATHFLAECFDTLIEAHPGDEPEIVAQLLNERRNSPGWERWVSLAEEGLAPTTAEALKEVGNDTRS